VTPDTLESDASYAPARATPVPGTSPSPFERVLHFGESRWGLAVLGGSLGIALAAHLAIGQARVLLAVRVSLPAFYKTAEYIDVQELPKEEPKEEKTPEPSPEAKSPNVPQDQKPTQEPPPSPAAKAGNLLTDPDPTGDKDVPTFVTDPNGQEYGSGTVAKGGTGDFGKAGAAASGVPNGTGTGTPAKGPPAPPPAPTIVAAADLSRKPTLANSNACNGYFPNDADDNEATVLVSLVVKPDGSVSSVSLVSEDPRGQGFGAGAKRCLSAQKLSPGLDRSGAAVTAAIQIRIHFTR
jgi:hypothetical protein